MSEFVENKDLQEKEELVEEVASEETPETEEASQASQEVEEGVDGLTLSQESVEESVEGSQEVEEAEEESASELDSSAAAEEESEPEGAEEEPTMETMEDALDSVTEVKVGDTVIGDVLAFDEGQVRVSIQDSGGLEGVIPPKELSATPVDDISELVNIGDEIELVVLRPIKDKENGNFILSKRRVDAKKVWDELQEKFDKGEYIEAPVKQEVKGGLVVDTGVRGFVPASMVEDYFVEDFTPYVGETLKFKIVEIEPSENRLILSHKEIAREEREAKKAERMAELEEGSIVTGKVARLVNFGAFIDLNGIDGLVHISRIAHEHVDKPGDYLTPGEEVDVKILSVDPEDGRVSLSIKDTLPGPWDNIEDRAPEGAVLDGIVKRLVSFGAFVEVFPGVEGLVHISQISHDHIATPHDRLEEGQEIQVKVLSVKPHDKRLSLSIKALEEAPERPARRDNEGGGGRQDRRSRRRDQGGRRQNNRSRPAGTSQHHSDTVESSFTMGDLLGDALKDLDIE